jgi:hypothetical protein
MNTEDDLRDSLRIFAAAASQMESPASAPANVHVDLPAADRRHRFVRPRLVVAGVLVAVLAAAVLVKDVVVHDGQPTPGTVADAGTFLATAAELTAAQTDPPIPPGQFRQVTLRHSNVHTFGQTRTVQARLLEQTEWWISSSMTPPYIARTTRLKVDFFNDADKAYAREHQPQLFKNLPPRTRGSVCGVDAAAVGSLRLASDPNRGCEADWDSPSIGFLTALPRDPGKLLTALTTSPGIAGSETIVGPEAADMAFSRIAAVLSSGIAPADLRAALYQAARKIPGLKLLDGAVNLDGSSGRAVSHEAHGFRTELIIAPGTGRFIGQRTVAVQTAPTSKDGQVLKDVVTGDVRNWTAVTTQIVKSAPAVRR